MRKIKLLLVLISLTNIVFCQNSIKLDSGGMKLKEFYLNQDVEHLWTAGQHIDWETGKPDNPEAKKNIKTHCSAFVASVCKQSGIYILRPPQHSQGLLANAQFDWLFSEDAYIKGWRQIKDSIYEKAQGLANHGYIVTAVYKNNDAKKPGHIALVMPVEKLMNDLYNEGPTLIQAGKTNQNFIALKNGFKSHIMNWQDATKIIIFFYNVNIRNL